MLEDIIFKITKAKKVLLVMKMEEKVMWKMTKK